jgi:hypothetical protein
MGGCKPAKVGHSLQVPDDDSWFRGNTNVGSGLLLSITRQHLNY